MEYFWTSHACSWLSFWQEMCCRLVAPCSTVYLAQPGITWIRVTVSSFFEIWFSCAVKTIPECHESSAHLSFSTYSCETPFCSVYEIVTHALVQFCMPWVKLHLFIYSYILAEWRYSLAWKCRECHEWYRIFVCVLIYSSLIDFISCYFGLRNWYGGHRILHRWNWNIPEEYG